MASKCATTKGRRQSAPLPRRAAGATATAVVAGFATPPRYTTPGRLSPISDSSPPLAARRQSVFDSDIAADSVFAFPLRRQQQTSSSSSGGGEWDEWHASWRRAAPRPSLAEQTFLCSETSGNFDQLRSFATTPSGKLVNKGFCYRKQAAESGTDDTDGSLDETVEGDEDYDDAPVRTGSERRRATCPPGLRTSLTTKVATRLIGVRLVGASGCGKSTLIEALLCQLADEHNAQDLVTASTDEAMGDGRAVDVLLNGCPTSIEMRETILSDDSLCLPLPNTLYILLYSVCDRASFAAVSGVLDATLAVAKSMQMRPSKAFANVVLIGNMIDLERKRAVKEAEGRSLARIYGCSFEQVSASLSLNIDRVMRDLLQASEICRIPQDGQPRKSSSLANILRSCERFIARVRFS